MHCEKNFKIFTNTWALKMSFQDNIDKDFYVLNIGKFGYWSIPKKSKLISLCKWTKFCFYSDTLKCIATIPKHRYSCLLQSGQEMSGKLLVSQKRPVLFSSKPGSGQDRQRACRPLCLGPLELTRAAFTRGGVSVASPRGVSFGQWVDSKWFQYAKECFPLTAGRLLCGAGMQQSDRHITHQ
jgi:hypothetical protein